MMAAERISAFEVREQLLRCFSQEITERFALQERALGLRTGNRAGIGAVETMVRLAFQQVGGSYDQPSREALTQVANLLAERSLDWGTPAEMVLDCHENVMRQIACVDELPAREAMQTEPMPN